MVQIPMVAESASVESFQIGSSEPAAAAFNVFPPAEPAAEPIPEAVAAEPMAEGSGSASPESPAEITTSYDGPAAAEAPPPLTDNRPEADKPLTAGQPPESQPAAAPQSREDLLRDAQFAVCDIGLEIDELRTRIADDKKKLKHLLEDLEEASAKVRDLRDGKDVQKDLPLIDRTGAPTAENPTVIEPLLVEVPLAPPQPPAASTPSADTDQSWRKVTIDQLNLSDIKGFGKKKREALAEVAPTLGDLEDLRAQAGAMGLQSVLPNGFGQKICDEIEDKIISWLADNRDRKVLAETAAAAEAADTDPAHSEDAEVEHLRARAEQLQELLSGGAQMHVARPDIAETGKQMAQNDEPLESCNWTAGDEQDSWLIGYLSVKSIETVGAA
jgi:hypothetical protein